VLEIHKVDDRRPSVRIDIEEVFPARYTAERRREVCEVEAVAPVRCSPLHPAFGYEAVPCQANRLSGLLVNRLPGVNNLLFAFTDE
jgi:hypothetical protein